MEARTLSAVLEGKLKGTPKSILIVGPRQTGKSTLLRKLGVTIEINLANESTYRAHLKDPALLESLVLGLKVGPKGARVLVDEVQRIPSMLNTIQALIDSHPKIRFLLTGSSARKLKRGQVNLLPGRIFRFDLFPMTYGELAHRWDLQKALTIGSLPEVYLNDYGPELLANYVDSYLREEIQAEALTRNVQSFARFLDLAAEISGQWINYSQLASDSEIPKETLRRYYDILEDTLLVHRLPGFTAIKGSRKALQREKIIFFDLGVRNAILGQQKNVFTERQLGEFFEQWLVNQVFAANSYGQHSWKLYSFRDDLKREVDLIIDRGSELWAVEIKYSTKFDPRDLGGLTAFAGIAKKKVRSILVYRGKHRQIRDDVEVMPYQEFLEEMGS
ncbi:MAG: ATP-binding protein [Bdellovibrionales bacterium]|nr:ATP-binding protein [Bdellovibrionales bacterium]